jgi:hypothetical protein
LKGTLTAGISTVATRREQFVRRFPALKRLSLPKSLHETGFEIEISKRKDDEHSL